MTNSVIFNTAIVFAAISNTLAFLWLESSVVFLLVLCSTFLLVLLNWLEGQRHKKDLIDLEKQLRSLIDENTLLNQREEQHKLLFDNLDIVVFSLDLKEEKYYLSNQLYDWFNDGVTLNDVGKDFIEEIISEEDKDRFLQLKKQWISGDVKVSFVCETAQGNEQKRWIELRAHPVHSNGKLTIVGMLMDITDQKEKEEHLTRKAYYDVLTNLPNRTMLQSHLKKVISRSKRKQHEFMIMFIDLDNFKQVNDTLGHDAGDELLKEVAERLNSSVREEDLISRLGGDEFIIVIEETGKEEVSVIGERILQALSKPVTLFEEKITISPSIGISHYPEDGDSLETLIKNADKAMYLAKEKGKNNFQFYTPELENYQPKESVIDKILKFFQK